MFPAIKGYYDKGQIFFSENPPVSAKTNVIITFLQEEEAPASPKRIWNSLKGKIFVSDSFDDPLDELKDYM